MSHWLTAFTSRIGYDSRILLLYYIMIIVPYYCIYNIKKLYFFQILQYAYFVSRKINFLAFCLVDHKLWSTEKYT